jgi:hypothetical protein
MRVLRRARSIAVFNLNLCSKYGWVAKAALPPEKSQGTCCTGGCLTTTASLDGCGEDLSHLPCFEPTTQSVDSRYERLRCLPRRKILKGFFKKYLFQI